MDTTPGRRPGEDVQEWVSRTRAEADAALASYVVLVGEHANWRRTEIYRGILAECRRFARAYCQTRRKARPDMPAASWPRIRIVPISTVTAGQPPA